MVNRDFPSSGNRMFAAIRRASRLHKFTTPRYASPRATYRS